MKLLHKFNNVIEGLHLEWLTTLLILENCNRDPIFDEKETYSYEEFIDHLETL